MAHVWVKVDDAKSILVKIPDDATDEERAALTAGPRPKDHKTTDRMWRQGIASDGAAVHPSQIAEAAAYDVKMGNPTEYTRDGRPIFHSQGQKRTYLKGRGLIDKQDYNR